MSLAEVISIIQQIPIGILILFSFFFLDAMIVLIGFIFGIVYYFYLIRLLLYLRKKYSKKSKNWKLALKYIGIQIPNLKEYNILDLFSILLTNPFTIYKKLNKFTNSEDKNLSKLARRSKLFFKLSLLFVIIALILLVLSFVLDFIVVLFFKV